MKQNFYFLLTLILFLYFYSATFAQVAPADSFFPSAVGNTWIYDTPAGLDTMLITKDSMDSGGNKFIFYNNDSIATYKIDSSGENIYDISNGLNLFKFQLNSDSGNAWIEDPDAPIMAAKVNGIFPYYIFGKPRDVKQIGYYKIPGDTSLFDNFSHGIDTAWTILSGTFSVDNFIPNPLSENQYSLVCNQSGIIGIPCSQAYGTWQFDIYKGADNNNFEVDFIADRIDNAIHQNGYYFTNNSSEAVGLARSEIGSAPAIMSSADNYTAKEDTWYRITITRNSEGEFYTYIEGGEFTSRTLISVLDGYGTNPATDTSYTVSNYFVLNLEAGDRISNIVCEHLVGNIMLNENNTITLSTNSNFEDSIGTWVVTGNHSFFQSASAAHSGSYGLMIINTNLITNGTFDSNINNWGLYDFGGGSGSATWDAGKLQITYTVGSTNGQVRRQNIISDSVINKVFKLSFDSKASSNDMQWKFIALEQSGSPYQNNYFIQNLSLTTSFANYNYYTTITNDVNPYLHLYFVVQNSTTGTWWLDNVKLAQVGNLIDNYISLPVSAFDELQSKNKYTCEMWYKSPYLNGDTLTVNIGDQSKTIASSDTWTKLTWTFQADDSTINQPIKIFLNQADTLYIDDVSLKPTTTLFDKAVYESEIWLADGIGEYYEYSKEKGELRSLESCIINGDTLYTSVRDNKSAALNSFRLYQNYPNPFNPVTNIDYNIPERGKVVIDVYDILGRKVASLVNEVQSAGFHSVRFSGDGLASGVYIYRIVAGKFSESKKLVLLR